MNAEEKEFEQKVVDFARLNGWKAVGHRTMQVKDRWATGWLYDGVGWPDLTLIHPKRGLLVAAELKTATGKLSDEQLEWADTLEALESNAAGHVKYFIWRPAQWKGIQSFLAGLPT